MNRLMMTLIPGLLMAASAAATTTDWLVSWDTSELAKIATANNLPIYFAVGLTSGGGSTFSSYVTLTEFDLGGGFPYTGFVLYDGIGSAFGNMTDGMALDDLNGFFAGVLQKFQPGQRLNFRLGITASYDGGIFPDSLSFGLYTDDIFGLITPFKSADPQSGSVAARADLGDGIPMFETYASTYEVSLLETTYSVPAPVIVPYTTPVPEPASSALAALGITFFLIRRWRR